MNKLKIAGIISAAMLIVPAIASAATFSNPVFSNGDTTIDATGGATVNGTVTLQVGQNEVCEITRTNNGIYPITDNPVGGSNGLQWGTYPNLAFSVKTGPNTETEYPTIQCAGIWGGSHSVDGNDQVIAGPTALGTIRVTSSGSGSTGASGNADINVLLAQIVALTAQLNCQGSGGTWSSGACTPKPAAPAVSPACSAYAQAIVGAMQGIRNEANIGLQGFLISPLGGRQSIPALAAGASFGFWGTQTETARISFLASNGSCR